MSEARCTFLTMAGDRSSRCERDANHVGLHMVKAIMDNKPPTWALAEYRFVRRGAWLVPPEFTHLRYKIIDASDRLWTEAKVSFRESLKGDWDGMSCLYTPDRGWAEEVTYDATKRPQLIRVWGFR